MMFQIAFAQCSFLDVLFLIRSRFQASPMQHGTSPKPAKPHWSHPMLESGLSGSFLGILIAFIMRFCRCTSQDKDTDQCSNSPQSGYHSNCVDESIRSPEGFQWAYQASPASLHLFLLYSERCIHSDLIVLRSHNFIILQLSSDVSFILETLCSRRGHTRFSSGSRFVGR